MASALKEQGNACFRGSDYAGALARFQDALGALEACRDAAGELSVKQEADAVACHANAAACALKLGRATDAVASACAGLALPSAAIAPQLQAKLYARLSVALEAAGEADTPRATDARTRPARLGLPPLERDAVAEAAAAAARNRISLSIMGMLRGELVTKAALKAQVLSAFGDKLHPDARDQHGMGVLWAATGGMVDMNPQPHVPTGWLLRELLALGADPSSRFLDSRDSRMPLMYCAHAGDTPAALEAAEILLKAGARVNARSGDDWTALMTALATDDREPGWRCGKIRGPPGAAAERRRARGGRAGACRAAGGPAGGRHHQRSVPGAAARAVHARAHRAAAALAPGRRLAHRLAAQAGHGAAASRGRVRRAGARLRVRAVRRSGALGVHAVRTAELRGARRPQVLRRVPGRRVLQRRAPARRPRAPQAPLQPVQAGG